MKSQRIFLLPFSLIYGIVVYLRNGLFNLGVLPSEKFSVPVISVGNLSTGGTGKTPHIEYLVTLLKTKFKIAVLSRGYKRKTSGFIEADENATWEMLGDEPYQIFQKHKDIILAVDSSRVRGIKKLLKKEPLLDAVLLDDAFQHRYVMPDISILLTDYSHLYCDDFLLPAGNLREGIPSAQRADVIIVTKTPPIFSPLDKRLILGKLKLREHQKVFFSYLKYGDFIPFMSQDAKSIFGKEYYLDRNYTILLVTGIANSASIKYYLKEKAKEVVHIPYSDHHDYTVNDVLKIKEVFEHISNKNKIILATEKDIIRLSNPDLMEILKPLPLFYLPVTIKFHENDALNFNELILNYVATNRPHSRFH